MYIVLKEEYNQDNELERTFISFKSKGQRPLIMVIKEYSRRGRVTFASVIWRTKF